MKKFGVSIFILLLILSFQACYYDKADLVYPLDTAPCDTTAVSYATDITTILTANCYSCHSGTAIAGAGIKLDTYTTASNEALKGTLLHAIQWDGGYSAMPKNGARMSACNIAKIRAWINKNAPNN